MIIGIDIRVLGSPGRGGIKEYTENLLAAMLPLDASIRFKLFYASYRTELGTYPWRSLPHVGLHTYRIPNRLLLTSAQVFNIPKVDRMLSGVDVFFSPHFIMTSLSPSVKRVTTFHDLSFEQFPEFFSRKQWLWHQSVQPAWQARFSDNIIAVSESTRRDIIARYRIDPARIRTVHSGVSSRFQCLDASEVEEFRVRRQLPREYILFLGTFEPRKNIVGLIRAFELLQRMSGTENLHLVIAGSGGWLSDAMYTAVRTSSCAGTIRILEPIADDERPLLYNAARQFVYPSFFEGFGFPPLEAMACGVPVITSNTSSLPEVVRDAGLLVDPYSISALADAMHTVYTDHALAQFLVARGKQRAHDLSWQKTAEKTLEILTR